jgi:hypothetical protein
MHVAWDASLPTLVVTGFISQLVVMPLVWAYFLIGKLAPVSFALRKHQDAAEAWRKDAAGLAAEIEAAKTGQVDQEILDRLKATAADLALRTEQMQADLEETEELLEEAKDAVGYSEPDKRRPSWRRWSSILIPWVILILLVSPFWLPISWALAVVGSAWLLHRAGRRHGRLTIWNTWYAFVFAMLITAVSSGLAGLSVGTSTAYFTFTSSVNGSHVTNGSYGVAGDDTSSYTLVSCSDPRTVAEVEKAGIVSAIYPRNVPGYSYNEALWQVLTGRNAPIELGYEPSCPESG